MQESGNMDRQRWLLVVERAGDRPSGAELSTFRLWVQALDREHMAPPHLYLTVDDLWAALLTPPPRPDSPQTP